MAHQWKEFVSAGTALRTEVEASSADQTDWGSSLHWHSNGGQPTNFFTGLMTGSTVKSMSSNMPNSTHNERQIETLSIDEDSDCEIQIVDCRLKKKQGNKRKNNILHVPFHKISSVDEEDEVQIIDDEDCSIVSSTGGSKDCSIVCSTGITKDCSIVCSTVGIEDCSIVGSTVGIKDCSIVGSTGNISKGTKLRPTEMQVPFRIPSPIPQQHWCIICRSYFSERKENHEKSIVHKVNVNDASPAPQVPASFNYSIPINNKGYQMLLAQGWDQSKGLGKDGKGLKTPVKTILKLDRSGLGNVPEPARVSHFPAGENVTSKWTTANKRRCISSSNASLAEKQQKEYELKKEIYNF